MPRFNVLPDIVALGQFIGQREQKRKQFKTSSEIATDVYSSIDLLRFSLSKSLCCGVRMFLLLSPYVATRVVFLLLS